MLKWREEGTFIEIQCTPGAFTNLSPQLCSMALNYCCCSIAKSCLTLATPWTVARQAPPSMAFPRQEYWSGLPFPSPGDLPHPRIEPRSPELQTVSCVQSPELQQILYQLSHQGNLSCCCCLLTKSCLTLLQS